MFIEERHQAILDYLEKNGRISANEIQDMFSIDYWNSIINSSKCTIGLYPTEKIGFESIISICPADRLDVLITDWDAPEDELKKFEKQGIKVVVVEKEFQNN